MQTVIAISGKNGQLGWELTQLKDQYPQYNFIVADRNELDITNPQQLADFFARYQPAWFINTAAYTGVDKAETDQANAYQSNAAAPGHIATLCSQYNTTFIHFSTDYVFNGQGTAPYQPDAPTDPVNYYGYTKAAGEQLALHNCEKTIIIRTSWVYSSHGNNFVKTMVRLMNERQEINVVADQVGSPTYARDLAQSVMHIITSGKTAYGIYHFSNEGVISWYDFALAIKAIIGSACVVNPIPTTAYPTPAKRPAYSVLSKEKLVQDYGVVLQNWQKSLAECMVILKA